MKTQRININNYYKSGTISLINLTETWAEDMNKKLTEEIQIA